MANITDKFGRAGTPTSLAPLTTVKTLRNVGETVLSCVSLAGFTEDTPVFFITYKKTTDPVTGEVTVLNKTSWKALANVTSNTLTNLTVAPGYTDVGNAVGDYIEVIPTSFWTDSLVEGLSVSHNLDGTLKDASVTLPKINGGTTAGVLTTDASGNVSVRGSNLLGKKNRTSTTTQGISSTQVPWNGGSSIPFTATAGEDCKVTIHEPSITGYSGSGRLALAFYNPETGAWGSRGTRFTAANVYMSPSGNGIDTTVYFTAAHTGEQYIIIGYSSTGIGGTMTMYAGADEVANYVVERV